VGGEPNELQTSYVRVTRQLSSRLGYPRDGCDGLFEGASYWDNRMENVDKLLGKAAVSTNAKPVLC
jgi:hypothetical protein